MKTLLIGINAKYIHTNTAVRLLKANSDFSVDILEYTIKDSIDEIVQNIEEYKPDILGFSAYIWNISLIIKIIDKLSLNGSKVVLGGPEVSYESMFFMKNYKIDYIIKGEGEKSFNLLLKALQSNSDIGDIPNLTYREETVIKSNPISEITDLDSLKSPYIFSEDLKHIPNKISYIESSRGCPYKCSYCLSSLEKTVRFFDVESVKETILYLMYHGSKTIKFLDRTFNANKNTLDLLEFIINHNNNYTIFQFEITGDILDPLIIEYLNENAPKGLFRFEIGIQSINYETNYLVDRHQNTEKLFHNIKLIQEKGIIDLHLDLIAGLPKENLDSFKHTFDEVFKLGAKELQLGFLKMLRGTKIRNQAELYKYKYHELPPYEITENDTLSPNDIKTIHLVEHMLEIYHNKGYFMNEMLQIILSKPSAFMFFYEIGKHYIKNNYPMNRYQVEDVYTRLFEICNKEEIYKLKKDYLKRSKIKPKIFFDSVKSNDTKRILFEYLDQQYELKMNSLYKHTVIIENDSEYFITYYESQQAITYTILKADINFN